MSSIPPRISSLRGATVVASQKLPEIMSPPRLNAYALDNCFWGENPGFACIPENSAGADEVIQQAKVPEGVTSSYFKRDKSQHIPKRIVWKSKSFMAAARSTKFLQAGASSFSRGLCLRARLPRALSRCLK